MSRSTTFLGLARMIATNRGSTPPVLGRRGCCWRAVHNANNGASPGRGWSHGRALAGPGRGGRCGQAGPKPAARGARGPARGGQPGMTFSVFGSSGSPVSPTLSRGPIFALSRPTVITEFGGVSEQLRLDRRRHRSVPGHPAIRRGIPRFGRWAPRSGHCPGRRLGFLHNDPYLVSYEFVRVRMLLPAGEYFALIRPERLQRRGVHPGNRVGSVQLRSRDGDGRRAGRDEQRQLGNGTCSRGGANPGRRKRGLIRTDQTSPQTSVAPSRGAARRVALAIGLVLLDAGCSWPGALLDR